MHTSLYIAYWTSAQMQFAEGKLQCWFDVALKLLLFSSYACEHEYIFKHGQNNSNYYLKGLVIKSKNAGPSEKN